VVFSAAVVLSSAPMSVSAAAEESTAGAARATSPQTMVSNDGELPSAQVLVSALAGLQHSSFGATSASAAGTGNRTGVQVAPDMLARADVGQLLAKSVGQAPETIIGTDNRYLISNTTTYPYRAVAEMNLTQGTSSGRCTAWFIGPDTVATAGHCVHTGGSSGVWSSNVRVFPGRNGSSTPYGSCTARRLYSVTGWTSNGDSNYDYGAVKLNCSIGSTVGWFGLHWQSASLTGQQTIIDGYPGDKPYTQWGANDFVRQTDAQKLQYDNDTVGGMSGSPVYNRVACNPCAIAIHTNGVYGGSTHNRGTRITQQVFNNLIAWRNAA
jgi:glutamyl endopeptidase